MNATSGATVEFNCQVAEISSLLSLIWRINETAFSALDLDGITVFDPSPTSTVLWFDLSVNVDIFNNSRIQCGALFRIDGVFHEELTIPAVTLIIQGWYGDILGLQMYLPVCNVYIVPI